MQILIKENSTPPQNTFCLRHACPGESGEDKTMKSQSSSTPSFSIMQLMRYYGGRFDELEEIHGKFCGYCPMHSIHSCKASHGGCGLISIDPVSNSWVCSCGDHGDTITLVQQNERIISRQHALLVLSDRFS